MADIEELIEGDHERLCQGREYICSCGYDERVATALSAQQREIAELRAENDRLRESCTSARAASKRAGRDLLREEADAALPHFGDDWEPLRYIALRAGARSAQWLATRARNLQQRGLVESQWIGNDRTSSFKVWRKATLNTPSQEGEKI